MARIAGRKGIVLIVAGAAAVVLALVALSRSFQESLQMVTADQFNRQQLLVARAHAAGIQHYFDDLAHRVGGVARALAQLPVRGEADAKLLGDLLGGETPAVRKRIEFLDARGGRIFLQDDASLAGAPAPARLARVRGFCPAGVLTESDARTVAVTAPVCRDGELAGAVTVAIHIPDVAGALLAPTKSGARSYAWIIDGLGNLLFHPERPEMAGRNLFQADASCFACHKSFDLEKQIIAGEGDDFGRYVAPTGEDRIVSYSTAAVGDARWIVAVSAPYSEVTLSTKEALRDYAALVILGFLATGGVAAGLIVLDRKREQAEERARREEVLEMAHAERLGSLERLTSGIAREIGSPLTSISSFVDVLMAGEKDELKRETLETIRLHMGQIEDILQRLSRFSEQPSAGLSPCAVNGLVEGALALIQYDRRAQNVTVVRDLAPRLPEISTDKPALSQVIVNLILRAADAMPGGGTLTIRSRQEGDRVVLEFADTGEGIARDELKRIFDPLPLDREKGRGGRLSVSLGMVRRLGGNLTAESEPEKGTTFTLTLPVPGAAPSV